MASPQERTEEMNDTRHLEVHFEGFKFKLSWLRNGRMYAELLAPDHKYEGRRFAVIGSKLVDPTELEQFLAAKVTAASEGIET